MRCGQMRFIRRYILLFCCTFLILVLFKMFVFITTEDAPNWQSRPNSETIAIIKQFQGNNRWKLNYTHNNERVPNNIIQAHQNSHLENIRCKRLFESDKMEQDKATAYITANPQRTISEDDYIKMASDCQSFRMARGYFSNPLSKEEYEFPLAFSILFYADMEQTERLLRAIYMPQNVYCLHVDRKADNKVQQAVRAIAKCFHNVFVASRLESVYWGHISVVYADMNCLEELLQYKWKYFINLTGQMFPLHSNAELVQILKLYNGANDIEGSYSRSRWFWLQLRQIYSWRLSKSLNTMLITLRLQGAPPHNVTIYKGSNQMAVTREFAKFILYNRKALNILHWFKDTLVPDEYVWPTLNHNIHLHAPGSYKGNSEIKAFTARASVWNTLLADEMTWSWKKWKCHGKMVRQVCIFGVGDLPWLYRRPELFANKFHINYQWLTYDCMEELIFNKNLLAMPFDLTYYKNLPFVKFKERLVYKAETQ